MNSSIFSIDNDIIEYWFKEPYSFINMPFLITICKMSPSLKIPHVTSLAVRVVHYDLVLSSLPTIYAFDNEMSNENVGHVSGHQFTEL